MTKSVGLHRTLEKMQTSAFYRLHFGVIERTEPGERLQQACQTASPVNSAEKSVDSPGTYVDLARTYLDYTCGSNSIETWLHSFVVTKNRHSYSPVGL